MSNSDSLITDTRVQHIAEVTGESPEDVVKEAEAFAREDGVTVDEELTEGDELATLYADAEALGDDGPADDTADAESYGDATL